MKYVKKGNFIVFGKLFLIKMVLKNGGGICKLLIKFLEQDIFAI